MVTKSLNILFGISDITMQAKKFQNVLYMVFVYKVFVKDCFSYPHAVAGRARVSKQSVLISPSRNTLYKNITI